MATTLRLRSRLAAAALAGACLALLTGCAAQVITPPAVTVTNTPTEDRSVAPTPPPDPKPAVVWPLTGLSAEDVAAEDMNRPALSIKIENSPFSRPQSKIDLADTVYETYVEYGISRLVVIFHSNYPESAGPIRSMRPMDQYIMSPYGGPLIFSGAQGRFVTAAKNNGVDLIAQDLYDEGFFRVNTNAAPHNLHGYLAEFAEQAVNKNPPPEQYHFAYPAEFNTAAIEGAPVSLIDMYFSSTAQPEWHWDATANRWARWELTWGENAPHLMLDGTPVQADNVVILRVKVKYTSHVKGGKSVPETLISGQSGGGFVAADGKYVAITWSKASRTDPIVLTTLDGAPVQLKPGQTWVELLPYEGTPHKQTLTFS